MTTSGAGWRPSSCPRHETWVAVEPTAERSSALMALSDDMVEQLYVAPAWIGRGLGKRLVALAKERRPAGLDLYCFAVNSRARRFYERTGSSRSRSATAATTRSASRTSATPGGRRRDGVATRPTRRRRVVRLDGRDADRRLHLRRSGRRWSSSTARPPTTPRSGSSGRCWRPGSRSTPSTAAAGARRVTRRPTPSSASSRTWPPSRRRSRARPAARSTSSGTRTAAVAPSARRC